MKAPTMEELFATMPDIPEGFKEGCMEYASPVPIYYRRKGKYAECICGKCAMPFLREEQPTRGDKTHCSYCGTEGLYEWKKCTNEKREYFTVVLVQRRTDNNLVLRHFKCVNTYQQGARQRFTISEQNRQFANMGDFWKFNKISSYLEGDKWGTGQAGITYADILYPGYQEEIEQSNLKYFEQGYDGFIEELRAYARNPAIELYRKMGLKQLAKELVSNEGRSKNVNRRGKNVKAQLRLKDKQRINYLVKVDGGIRVLQILQTEEKTGQRFSDDQRKWLDARLNAWNGERDVRYMMKFMTFTKLYNRVKKYAAQEETKGSYAEHAAFTRYVDYIKMREELGYDMTNEVYLFPKNLREKHDEMVVEKNAKSDQLYAEKKEKEFPKIRERFEKLMKEYGFQQEGMLIRPAESATEIVMEGRTLHHCVGRMGYMDKHNKGQTFILFLRKEKEQDKPYYTIEIRGKEILQWYGAYDRKPDQEVVGPWLNKFIAHIGGSQVVYG